MPQNYVDPKSSTVNPYPTLISMHGSIRLPSFTLLTRSARFGPKWCPSRPTSLGIGSNGLTVATCNVNFWSVVIPITLLRTKLLLLSERGVALVGEFQVYTWKRVQRFFRLVLTIYDFYALGLVCLEKLVEVKTFFCGHAVYFLNTQKNVGITPTRVQILIYY